MRNILKNKTLWLSFALLCIIAGSILTISWFGTQQMPNNHNTMSIAEATTTLVPETEPDIKPLEPEIPLSSQIGEFMQVSALSDTGYGIESDSEFLLSGLEKLADMTAITLQNYVSIEPNINFELIAKENGQYLLKLKEALPTNKVINISLHDTNGVIIKSWAFQTESSLKVTKSYPGDCLFVELNSGIEIAFSSANLSTEAFEQYFDIQPAIKGTITKNGRSFVFAPSEVYQEHTIYKVTIKQGLQSESGQKLAEDYKFSFQTTNTADNYNGFSLMDNKAETFLPGETPIISLYGHQYTNQEVTLKLYSFSSAESYLEALNGYLDSNLGEFHYDTSQLSELILEQKLPLFHPTEDNLSSAFVILPNALPIGYYVADISAAYLDSNGKNTENICTAQKFLQISDISVGFSHAAEEMLFWINNTTADKACKNAKITLQQGNERLYAQTDADGLAVTSFPFTEKEGNYIYKRINMTIEYEGSRYVDVITLHGQKDDHLYNYYSYLYTDRAIYHNTDTINVFGLLVPRSKQNLPKELYLTLNKNAAELLREPVSIETNGSFKASLSFADYSYDMGYYLRLKDKEGNIYAEQYISISQYQNPVYVVTSSVDKPFYEVKDEALGSMHVKCSFFDGTPAAGMQLQLRMFGGYDNIAYNGNIVLNSQGEADVPFAIYNFIDPISYDTHTISYSITNDSANNEENIYHYQSFPVLYRDLILQGERTDKGYIFKTNLLDTSKITDLAELDDYKNFLGAAHDTALSAKLFKVYYTKEESGQYYDYIQKQSVTTYRYIRHEDLIKSTELLTKDGQVEINDLADMPEDNISYFCLTLQYADTGGKLCQNTFYWGRIFYYLSDSNYRHFTFKNNNNEDVYNFSFQDNENLSINISENEVAVTTGRFLCAQKAAQYTGMHVQKSTEPYEAKYDEKLLPCYYLVGLYFDGRHVFPISEIAAEYIPTQRELKLEIENDATQYRPGSKINVTVTAKKKDGSAAPNTSILLSVVDEAAFAVSDQASDILNGIYSHRYTSYPFYYTSYTRHDLNNGDNAGAEEGGEGGNEYIRSDFADTAFFDTLVTDKNGKAQFSFTLPDNLTTWRLTAQGYNKDLHAGNIAAKTQATQDFFINPVITSSYLAGDEASISLSCYGKKIKGEETVDYNIILDNGSTQKQFTSTGKSHDYTFISLGKLQEGNYTLTIKAKSGNYQDTIEKALSCVTSGVSVAVSQDFDLATKLNISPVSYPVLLSFSDSSCLQYNQLLSYLMSNSYGTRAEQQMASEYVLKELQAQDSFRHPEFANYDSPFCQSGSTEFDYELCAWAALAMPSKLNRESFIQSFYSLINNYNASALDISASYMGLAALGEPVLLDIRYLLNSGWFDYEENLYLLLGLSILGDNAMAEEYYNSLIASKINPENSITAGDMAKLGSDGDDAYAIQFHTAMALCITNALHKNDEATLFANYLLNHNADRYLYLLQLIYYSKHLVPTESEPASFSYVDQGKTVIIDFAQNKNAELWLSKEQLESADFRVLQGKVHATAFYNGAAALLNDSTKQLAAMNKNIKLVNGSGGPGSLYLVTLTVKFDKNAPYGNYIIEDYIPSGCRFVRTDNVNTDNWYQRSQALQNISFVYQNVDPALNISIYGHALNTELTTVRYYIRSLLPGSYVLEEAMINHFESGAWGKSAKAALVIR